MADDAETSLDQKIKNRHMLIPSNLAQKPVIRSLCNDEQGIIARMRCSFCKNVAPAPLKWACRLGHIICTDCAAYVPCCPWEPPGSTNPRNMCRQGFNSVELEFYNYLYNKSKFECSYKNNGCKNILKGIDDHIDHNLVCEFKSTEDMNQLVQECENL